MRWDLRAPIAAPVWPDGVALRPFTTADAPAVHVLLRLVYANGGGSVGPLAEWWAALAADSEYDPALCFTVWSGDTLIGAAQCWTSAFVKDLVVHPDWQRRGVGKVLLMTAFQTFRNRGASSVDLKVQANNAGAIRFYENLQMVRISS
jgi:ribosomal protein S18 acetylase RimI-like enzyme